MMKSVGLDIGAYALKCIQTSKSRSGVTVLKAGYKELPLLANRDPEGDVELYATAIKELFQEQEIKANKVRISISDPNVYSRQITLKNVPESEMQKAMKWQAEKFIPFSIDEAVIDYQELTSNKDQSDGQKDIIIVAADNKTINKYVSILMEAGLSASVLDLSMFAMVKTHMYKAQKK